jgi:hypothetical protein
MEEGEEGQVHPRMDQNAAPGSTHAQASYAGRGAASGSYVMGSSSTCRPALLALSYTASAVGGYYVPQSICQQADVGKQRGEDRWHVSD